MTADLFVHLRPLTPIEARVLWGVLSAWCNNRNETDPAWDVVDSLRTIVGEARDAHDSLALATRASTDA